MQYIDYEYAKKHKIVGAVVYSWLRTVEITTKAKGHVLRDWKNGKLLLNIGEWSSGSSIPEIIEDWSKQQANRRFHKSSYQKAYLKGYFKL